MSRIGWFSLPPNAANGRSDLMLGMLVEDMSQDGLRIAGARQINLPARRDCACDMDVTLIGAPEQRFRISQSLGPGASACRLDAGALQQAANAVERAISEGADLVILPKFGKQEAIGRGFSQAIAQAVGAGIPVLLHVASDQIANFLAFADDLADRVPPEDLRRWCHAITRQPA